MAFDFNIVYIKGNIILHVNALSQLHFDVEASENCEDRILHWIETDVLPLTRLRLGIRQDPMLNRIIDEIKRNTWNNCSMAERSYKESIHKLRVEK